MEFDAEAVVLLLSRDRELFDYLRTLKEVDRVAFFAAVAEHIEDLEGQV
jgi:hypothetical protein